MAQTQSHQLPPQSFSPPISSPSPGAQSPVTGIPPPPKRQRLSPLPQPQSTASPSFGTLQLPRIGSPVAGTPPNSIQQQQQKPMNAPPPPGSMGPPSRPVEKATDAAELTDVLASSGIDVREEEAFLTSDYGKPQPIQPQPAQQHQQQQPIQPPRINTNLNTSFGSQPSFTSAASAGNSFADQTPKQPIIKPAPYAQPGPAPSPVKTEEMMRDEKLREDTAASRREQYHLQASFLQTALVEKKFEKRCVEHGVRLPVAGVFRPLPGRQPGPLEITGPDGSSIIRRDKTLLTSDSPLGDIISLLSLASEERLRSVVDHSATLARNRRVNSHGLVPPEWTDLAGNTPQHAPDTTPDAKEKPPITPLSLALKSRRLIDKDESFEERRAAKRAKRNADAILGNESRAGSVGASTPGGATPTAQVSERAPDVDKKSSKKDVKKADAKATGAVQHQHAVETARMSIQSNFSSRFGKKGGYSWLQTAQPAASRSGFSTPTRQNALGGAPTTNGTSKSSGANRNVKGPGKRLGDWREDDKEGGAGIQIRDLLFMLEEDGRGLKHLQKAYSKDPKEDIERPTKS